MDDEVYGYLMSADSNMVFVLAENIAEAFDKLNSNEDIVECAMVVHKSIQVIE